ncbi:phospho-N-acetylmuramoyl-pentapeptide-transferase [Alkalibacterium pelagium]|uniref:Phospho-N-acetylmuramoyl-pentapeptide-transferase n=2 Tax=Alkalibacterium pelagium TaxID=426702 RepID=A0A1H7GV41_9LACT|nr:phospho-N-acetylmuramoyl-pentapeptide-transferase [Alkalibacterium pelagium]SEK41948.1 Phospho-N-acetylmuramoyl-pentapeptide-transferase [Alkalibacterium pelagium]
MDSVYLVMALVLSGLIAASLMPTVISYFKKKQLGQTTREEGPSWHESKSGTPTMGGLSILISVVLSSLIFSVFIDGEFWLTALLVFIFIVFALIGFVDDYIKVVMKRNLGLTSLQKLLAQIAGAVLFYFGVSSLIPIQTISLPFNLSVSIGWVYIFFVLFWLVGFSNATNLTDGIDGLLATTGMIAYGAYTIIAVWQEQWEVAVFTAAVVGALIGFFIFNKKPAKVFMGDVGSLALGAGLAGASIILDQEWTLLIIGLVFVIETASVMLQVGSFKLRGKRIFKMSPIHHHFEMSGWGEWKIVIIFSIITLITSILALISI